MLQITPQMKILVAVEPADFRRGIDGLVRLCKDSLGQDPFAGAVLVFRNRRPTRQAHPMRLWVTPCCCRRRGCWDCGTVEWIQSTLDWEVILLQCLVG